MAQKKIIRPVIYITTTMTLAIVVVVALYLKASEPIRQKNGFSRQFTQPAIQTNAIDLKLRGEIMSICGATGSRIYFQTKNPEQLMVTDRQLRGRHFLSLSVPYDKTLPSDKKIASRFHFLVDSPRINIFAGNVPAILTGDFSTKKPELHRFPSSLFIRAVAIAPRSVVLRGFDTATHPTDQILMKGDPVSGVMQRKNNLPEQRGDMISTDGLLHYDAASHLLAYVYFYSNRILCLDTNLNLVYKGHTIDTFTTYQTKAGSIPSGNTAIYTKIAPTRFVNRESCVADGKLFNYSALKSDNESDREFANNSVIDVYNLKDGAYQHSFYIPVFRNERLKRFRVFDNLIVVIYNNYIVTYRLPPASS